MSLALQLPTSLKVAVLSKTQLGSGSTFWAQGGMAAVLHDRDTVQAHVSDTLSAGAGLCHEPAVQFTVGRSRQIVDWLISQGMNFDLREDQQDAEFREFHLTTEGGHSHRRVIHAADQTGRALSEVLATSDVPAGAANILTGSVAELAPWLASHADVNGLDLTGVSDTDLAVALEQSAAETLTRVTAPRTGEDFTLVPGLDRMLAVLEIKTVWHPTGV